VNSGFLFMPGEIIILGGNKIIDHFDAAGISLNFSEAVCYELDPQDGTLKRFAEPPSMTKSVFSFDPQKTACCFFEVEGNFESLSLVDEYVEKALHSLPVDQIDVRISASEILHNAIKEAVENTSGHALQVSLLYLHDLKVLLVGVTDDLGRLDLSRLDLSFEDNCGRINTKLNGRGLATVARLMSALGYNPGVDGFKEIFFIVYLHD